MVRKKSQSVAPSAYLLTWNPASWDWDGYERDVRAVKNGDVISMSWRCHNKGVQPGDEVFLLRQGAEARGLVGFGHAVAEPEVTDGTRFVDVEFEQLVTLSDRLDRSELTRGALREAEEIWKTRFSGRIIPAEVAAELARVWSRHLDALAARGKSKAGKTKVEPAPALQSAAAGSEVVDDELSGFEGEARRLFVVHRKRERALRERKIRESRLRGNGRVRCEVPRCGFDFEEVYGPLGENYAHVHHIQPLATRASPSETHLSELSVVCANCHAMIHRGGQSRPIEDLIPQRSAARPSEKASATNLGGGAQH